MKRYFLETSTIINYLKGHSKTVDIINDLEGELSSSFICMAELYEGIFRVEDKKEQEKGVLDFFSGFSDIFSVNDEVAKKFGQIRADLKKKGKVIEDLDIFIAATCLVNNLTLVTSNVRHFKRIEGLHILEV